MIFPEATGQNCWDAGSTRSLKHDGGGDTGAIVQMVKYALAKYGGDAGRVYSVGGSSGGIMTEALLGVYPDVFMAGVSLMGVPCGCWAQGYNDVTGAGAPRSGAAPARVATSPRPGRSGETWFVRYFPGYTGHRPRLQHWHGTADTTLNYKNLAEDIKEWTNLLGLSETPTGTDTPKSGTTRQFWKSACGYTVYETFSMAGVGHAVPFDGNAVAAYFGLDKAAADDPETAACSGGTGTGGAGGATGAGVQAEPRGQRAGSWRGRWRRRRARRGVGRTGGGGRHRRRGRTGRRRTRRRRRQRRAAAARADARRRGGAPSAARAGPADTAAPSAAGASSGAPEPAGAVAPAGAENGRGGMPAAGGAAPGEDSSSGCGCVFGGHAPGADALALVIAALGLLRTRSKRAHGRDRA